REELTVRGGGIEPPLFVVLGEYKD
ncbi:MAG: hypothetical protein K0Q71_5951, partial [Thermomicrobiales bacterium]|nr:hypothetical protein [Thermomicrobiales bacterium]